MAAKSLKRLLAEGADLVRSAAHEGNSEKTEDLRSLAKVILEIRRRFPDDTGRPDWAGRTWDYRQAAASMYEAAGLPADRLAKVQDAVRYHVGNLLRTTLLPEELVEAGLMEASPKERTQTYRHDTSALLAALRATPTHVGGKGLIRLLIASESLLARLADRLEEVGPVTEPEAHEAAWVAWEACLVQIERLRDVVARLWPERARKVEKRARQAASKRPLRPPPAP